MITLKGEWSIGIDPLVSWSKRLRPSTLFQPRRFGDENMSEEIWKPVVGYEGLYEVSNHGRVRSLTRKTGFLVRKDRILKFNRHPNGYLLVSLSKHPNKPYKAKVHRMVAKAFIGDSSLDVDHIDRNPSNNHVSNLRYVTKRENQHNTKRLRGYPCVSENGCGGYSLSKGYGDVSLRIGTYETAHDAHRIEVACDTLRKAEFARDFIKRKRRTAQDTNKLLEMLKNV